MQAYPRPLKALFDGNYQYAVPLFQRRYVWNLEEQWEPLWKDVQRVAERRLCGQLRPHFLGAVVIKQAQNAIGMVSQWQIIDGQQRLTTLQLLIAAARDVTKGLSDDSELADAFDLMTRNPMVKDRSVDASFKVLPSKHDREDFRRAIRRDFDAAAGAGTQLQGQSQSSQIHAAYHYFVKVIEEWLAAPSPCSTSDKMTALQETIFNRLQLVVIDLEQLDDAQVIFETLNTRGAELLASDLVKNYLLDLATSQGLDVEQCYVKYWESFDTDDFWRQKVSQGRFYRPRADVFLQHYLALHLRAEVAADNLFASYQDFALNGGGGKAEELLKSMRWYGDIYRSFYGDALASAETGFFRMLEILDTTTLFPFLLNLYARLPKHSDAAARQAVLWDLESYLIRRMVCGLTTKNYNKVFIELVVQGQSEAELTPQMVRDFLLRKTGDSDRWPDDDEFGQAWRTSPLYRTLTRARMRLLLAALELGVRTKKHEHTALPPKLTIEHLMPQNWKANWPLPQDTAEAKEERERLIHTIGNLTLLTDSLNPDLSNSPWNKKRPKIKKYSLLALNHYFDELTEWDEQAIKQRSDVLLEVAMRFWARPN